MKQYLILADIAVILTAIMIAFLLQAEPATKTIHVPVTVRVGDTLNSICSPLAVEYGDVRKDLREIVYEVRQLNKVSDKIYPGDKLIVPLVVPVDAMGRR